MRVPRGITLGNLEDWGDYHQCLGIREVTDASIIEGKFCFIDVPVGGNESLTLSKLPDWVDFNPGKLKVNNDTVKDIKRYNSEINMMFGTKEPNERQVIKIIIVIQMYHKYKYLKVFTKMA